MKRLLLLLTVLLSACAVSPAPAPAAPAATTVPTPVPRTNPKDTVASFLLDLGGAVSDPSLIDPDVRGPLADKLAGYFLPAERVAQRQAFASALGNLARGIAQRQQEGRQPLVVTLEPGDREKLLEQLSVISNTGDRATVRPLNVQLVLSYGPTGETKNVTALSALVGQEDLPLIWDGERWYLTED